MGIFGNSSPFDQDVEKATSENNAREDWALILEICDRAAAASGAGARDCLRAVTRRLGHTDPHVQLQAVTLLDACASNCGRAFLLEIASRDFLAELRRLLQRAQAPVARRLRALLRKWAEGDFKDDPQLDLIPSLYNKLRQEGAEFDPPGSASPSPAPPSAAASAAAAAAREQDELARAIALSLRESAAAPAPASASASALYPRVEDAAAGAGAGAAAPAGRKVRALYDFEAAEDNELTFYAGEIVTVLDASDPNWWKGSNERGEGLFPSNFVSSDLAPPPSAASATKGGKSVQFAEAEAEAEAEGSGSGSDSEAGIDEAALDAALGALHEASPEAGAGEHDAALARLEARALRCGPRVDERLQRADKRHARLTQLSADLVLALNLYHDLMRAPPAQPLAPGPPLGMPPGVPGVPGLAGVPGMPGVPGVPGMPVPGYPAHLHQAPPVAPQYYAPPQPPQQPQQPRC